MSEQSAWLLMALWGLTNCLVFIIGYAIKQRGRWFLFPMGRHLMAFSAALGLAFALITASLIWGPLGAWLWIIALAVINLVLTQRNWYLFTKRWTRDQGNTGQIELTGTAPTSDRETHRGTD